MRISASDAGGQTRAAPRIKIYVDYPPVFCYLSSALFTKYAILVLLTAILGHHLS